MLWKRITCEVRVRLLYLTNAGYQVWWEDGNRGKVERGQGKADWGCDNL